MWILSSTGNVSIGTFMVAMPMEKSEIRNGQHWAGRAAGWRKAITSQSCGTFHLRPCFLFFLQMQLHSTVSPPSPRSHPRTNNNKTTMTSLEPLEEQRQTEDGWEELMGKDILMKVWVCYKIENLLTNASVYSNKKRSWILTVHSVIARNMLWWRKFSGFSKEGSTRRWWCSVSWLGRVLYRKGFTIAGIIPWYIRRYHS